MAPIDKKETIIVVTIDTEEDNWGQHRQNIQCSNIKEIPRLQSFFDSFGVIPTYLVSHKVAEDRQSAEILAEINSRGSCEIGAHLHPWNTPPEEEALSSKNSFLGNLPYELQLAKLRTLTNTIEKSFSVKPLSFRTGRWGLGNETIDALLECGYTVDTSVTPTLSWQEESGPSYTSVETDPYYIQSTPSTKDNKKSLFEIPATVGFNRWPFTLSNTLYRIAEMKVFKPVHLVGFLNRSSLLRKLWLTPEGFNADRMISLAKVLLSHHKRVLNISFHSNTLLAGATPFVQSSKDVDAFYHTLEQVLIFLNETTTVKSLSLSQVEAELQTFPLETMGYDTIARQTAD